MRSFRFFFTTLDGISYFNAPLSLKPSATWALMLHTKDIYKPKFCWPWYLTSLWQLEVVMVLHHSVSHRICLLFDLKLSLRDTYDVCRARRDDRVAPYCSTRATQHVTTYSCAKMHGLDYVPCRVVTWHAKWNLGYNHEYRRKRTGVGLWKQRPWGELPWHHFH